MRSLFGVYVLLSALLPTALGAGEAMEGMKGAMDIQREQIERMRDFLGPVVDTQSAESPEKRQQTEKKGSTITFRNPAAQKFFVDGTKIPDGRFQIDYILASPDYSPTLVNFDAGPSWSGLMPISGAKNETRKLFFW